MGNDDFDSDQDSLLDIATKMTHDLLPDKSRKLMDSRPRPSYTGAPRSVSITDPGSFKKEGRRVTLSGISNILPLHSDRVSRCTHSSIESERLQSQWEILMRKFSEDRKQKETDCAYKDHTSPADLQCEWRKKKTFATGSSYDGTWDGLGLCGYGRYTFPNGVVYEGEFEDNQFHGEGELKYPDGIVVRGRWRQGEIVEKNIIFSDGVSYNEQNWEYCKGPDRRYSKEVKDQVSTGAPTLTNEPMKKLPDGTFDAGEGIYYPKLNSIYAYDDPDRFIRTPDAHTVKWVTENCRFSPDRGIGPCPHLYEEWVTPSRKLPDPPQPPTYYPFTKESLMEEEYLCFRPLSWEISPRSKKSVSCESVDAPAFSVDKMEPRPSKESSVQNPSIRSGSLSKKPYKPNHARISEEIDYV